MDATTSDALRASGVHSIELRLRAQPRNALAAVASLGPDAELDRAVDAFLEAEDPGLSGAHSSGEALAVQVALLDAFAIPVGVKAQAIFMHRVWTAERVRRHGPAVNVHTLRRWRATRNRQQRRGATPGRPCARAAQEPEGAAGRTSPSPTDRRGTVR